MQRVAKKIICNETKKIYNSIRKCARDYNTSHVMILKCMRKNKSFKGHTFKVLGGSAQASELMWDESDTEAIYTYKGTQQIKTLVEALEIADVNLDVWEVDRWVKNSWDVTSFDKNDKPITKTNHQVKIWFKKRELDLSLLADEIPDKVYPVIYIEQPKKKAYIGLADFHVGALVKGLDRTQDYSTQILVDRLVEVANYINNQKYSEVYVGLLGDFIESFTGLNHMDSWKQLERNGFGSNSVITASETLSYFLSNVRNLSKATLVSGNHDRATTTKDIDADGDIGKLIYYIMDKRLDINIKYHPYVVSDVFDGICYIQTHGHLPLSKNSMGDILFTYGNQSMYNIIVQGHYHSRKKKEAYRVVDGVMFDKLNYRSITLPPMFTGNAYSERSGWTSTAGFNIITKNHKNQIEHLDVML